MSSQESRIHVSEKPIYTNYDPFQKGESIEIVSKKYMKYDSNDFRCYVKPGTKFVPCIFDSYITPEQEYEGRTIKNIYTVILEDGKELIFREHEYYFKVKY